MKRHLNILIMIVMLVGILAINARAQTASSQRLTANIPFAFNLGDKTLPAGRYTITLLSSTSDRRVIQLRSADGRSTAMVLTLCVNAKTTEDARVVFRRYGDSYFFAQAQLADDPSSSNTLKSRAERAQERALGMRKNSVLTIIAE
ncbi:MAG TPA: hypothetical protein VJ875_21075 [Pyrinomonadaceae bacterium]|nr:hypothetical protein [Pyrinomonadaceae bacterium]